MGRISPSSTVGINGIGRIGKLLAWIISARKEHEAIVISTGRKIGRDLNDLVTYLSFDSTYGPYNRFMFGHAGNAAVEVKNNELYMNGVKILWLNSPDFRRPGTIPWAEYGAEVIFDTTGKMVDPAANDDNSLRGHLNHGKKVILTAPFKVKNKGALIPDDAVTVVVGVNDQAYDPQKHRIISNASCTTNCCAPPIKALVDHFGDRMVSYALTTVHAATNSQSVLDTLPRDGDKDTRKRRSILNNIIPTSTGAANAVLEVIPEVRDLGIGSQASAIRVPSSTGSIVVMDISLLGEYDNTYINDIFLKYSQSHPEIMMYSDRQLVSSDIIGSTYSTIYDSPFTHRRTSKRDGHFYTMADLNFWYDNEFGYVNSLMRLYDLVTSKK